MTARAFRLTQRHWPFHLWAMANADGGILAIGISDKTRRIEGVDQHTENLNELLRVPYDFCKPTIKIRAEYIPCEDAEGNANHILLMHIPASSRLHTNQQDEAYMRVGDKSKKLTFDERLQLLYDKGERYFEDEAAVNATVDDIDITAVQHYVQTIGYSKTAMEYLRENNEFLKEVDGEEKVSNACILLFGKYPQKFFPRARTRFIRYEGTDEKVGTEMNVIKDVTFEGTILRQVQDTIAYLETQVREHSFLGQDGRFVTNRNYPKFAIQEMVVNSCCHRDYGIRGTEIQIKMFDDRIVFESPGTLSGLVRLDNIRHTHFSRNPKIAEYLKAYKYVKEFGEGIDRICLELEKHGSAIPTFHLDAFILKATLKAEWMSEKELERPSTAQVPAQVPPKYRPSTAQVEKLVAVMGEEFINVTEIMDRCDIVRRKTIQNSYLTPALADGTIERRYPDQPKRPDQMYRLTEAAKSWKAENANSKDS